MDVKELGNISLVQHRDEGRNCAKMYLTSHLYKWQDIY